MARELNVSRNVVLEVYEQLTAEGYLESRVGSGTYVAGNINRKINNPPNAAGYEKREDITDNKQMGADLIYFASGIPDLKLFPTKIWSKYMKEAFLEEDQSLYGYGNISGDIRLRRALTDYLFRMKGIQCTPEQILIVSGSSEGFILIAKALADTYNSVFVEEPTVNFIKNIFLDQGYTLKPVKVDDDGINTEELEKEEERNLAVITPSHQFPTGSILTIQKRQRLIEFTERTGSFLVEDDYDSEFRLKGIPIPPLQVLNPSRVIYVGTFSKNCYPGLRLGFLVVPVQLLNKFIEVKRRLNMYTPTIKQRAMAGFIAGGHLERHIYTIKKIYKKRRELLHSLLVERFKNDIRIKGDETGMHLQVEFTNPGLSNLDWDEAKKYGVEVDSFAEFCLNKGTNRNKIVLGYGNLNDNEIQEGVNRLYTFVHNRLRGRM
jgi:GntR family transcriptional regulator/MocR family aminotransferase